MDVTVELQGAAALPIERIRSIIICVLEHERIDGGEIGVQFVDEQQIAALNREHRGIDEVTDVLSFPIDGSDPLPEGIARQLGDLAICASYVAQQLARGETMAADTTLERALERCIVHGVLHLLGYDHEVEGSTMFDREQQLMELCRG